MSDNKKHIAILGSTGSIGSQALEVIRAHPDKFIAEILTANGNSDLLIKQAKEFMPNAVVIAEDSQYAKVRNALIKNDIKVFTGAEALKQVVTFDSVDLVLTAIVGVAALESTISAIEEGKNSALANHETLVVAGEIVTRLAREKGINIYPVDSEHSAIFQCLAGEFRNPIEKIILTASGGPFRGMSLMDLAKITKAQALKHPNWDMGAKITIDSASMMNKGLEVIEAQWLFGIKAAQIEVIVHPQSIIHSMVQFKDGSIKAQMGLPDMRLPIQYAFGYPNRLSASFPRFSFADYPALTFEKPDMETFKNLALAFNAIERGGNMPCILNAANEVIVKAFLNDRIQFIDMPNFIQQAMEQIDFVPNPSINDLLESDLMTRNLLIDLLNK